MRGSTDTTEAVKVLLNFSVPRKTPKILNFNLFNSIAYKVMLFVLLVENGMLSQSLLLGFWFIV